MQNTGFETSFWPLLKRSTTLITAVVLVLYPLVASDFFTYQVGAYSLLLGLVALSLMMLAGYGGMVSVAQLTVAGFAGYMIAIFGLNRLLAQQLF